MTTAARNDVLRSMIGSIAACLFRVALPESGVNELVDG